MIIRLRELIVAGAGLLVLGSGWLPWWVVRVQVSDDSGTRVATFVGSAWQTSSRWSAATTIAATAVAVWLIWRVRARTGSVAGVADRPVGADGVGVPDP